MSVYGYVRVSTTEQAVDDRASLAAQDRVIAGAALVRGATVDRVFCDAGVSGAQPLTERPEGGELLRCLRKGDVVIAAKLDRMFRNAADALATVEELQRRGVDLVLVNIGTDPVTANGASKLFFSMLTAFAEFERSTLRERLAMGKAGKAACGGHIGGSAPFGFTKQGVGRDATLVPDPGEQAVIAAARALATTGLSLRQVAAALAVRGMVSRTGRPFGAEQVQRMLA